jgi:hypothetical protein
LFFNRHSHQRCPKLALEYMQLRFAVRGHAAPISFLNRRFFPYK